MTPGQNHRLLQPQLRLVVSICSRSREKSKAETLQTEVNSVSFMLMWPPGVSVSSKMWVKAILQYHLQKLRPKLERQR